MPRVLGPSTYSCCRSTTVRDDAWVERPGTRLVPGYKFEHRFFRCCFVGYLVYPKISKLLFWKESLNLSNKFGRLIHTFLKYDLDYAWCSVNYYINGVLKQKSNFENCSRGLLLVWPTRAQVWGLRFEGTNSYTCRDIIRSIRITKI